MRLLFIITILSFFVGSSQADLLNTKHSNQLSNVSISPDNEESIPLDYPSVNDNDIIFSFTVWEVIDLAQRVNFPYLYPINESLVTPDRKPLFWHLINGIKEYAFEGYASDRFIEPMSEEEINRKFKNKKLKEGDGDFDNPIGKDKLIDGWGLYLEQKGYQFPEEDWVSYDPTNAEAYNALSDSLFTLYNEKWEQAAAEVLPETDFDIYTTDNDDVTRYVIKGMWYFDKKDTELKYRPIAFGPIATSAEDKADGESGDSSNRDSGGNDNGSETLLLSDGVTEIQFQNFYAGSTVSTVNPDAEVRYDDYGSPILSGDVEMIPLAVGQYTLEDDRILIVKEKGTIAESDDFPKEPEEQSEAETAPQNNNSVVDTVSDSDAKYEPLFWVFYRDVRGTLANAYCLNQANMSKPISFDRLINSRRFSATIYKEANVYEDRDIRDYIRNDALKQLLESERIKEKIRNKEQDMWSY
tara:strand:+ start:778 stop:2184 length:1407 start_codon:yes stop_codon:yes gene_type:complete